MQLTRWMPGDPNNGIVVKAFANYFALMTDDLVAVDATNGPVRVTLPSASGKYRLSVKKVDASVNSVTVSATGADLIDGLSTYALTLQNQSADFHSDGGGNVYVI